MKLMEQHCSLSLKNRKKLLSIFHKSLSQSYKKWKQKIVNLLNGSENENSKFATKKWYVIDSESEGNYSDENEIKFLTSVSESNLCNYSDAYILVTGNINVTGGDANTRVAFKNCVPVRKEDRNK